jgi:hypothetical protein
MPSPLIDDIITELREKYNLSRSEIERIIDSPFRVARTNIENKSLKIVNLIYLGKIRPTSWLIENIHKYEPYVKKDTRDSSGLVESSNKEEGTSNEA